MNQLERNLAVLFDKYSKKHLIPGLSAHVYHKGRTVAKVVNGLADLGSGKPLQEDSIFRVFSMSKVITVIATMQLYEKGYFTLDTPVSEFIPAFGKMNVISGYRGEIPLLVPATKPLSMKHLFTMTSGIGYGFLSGTDAVDRYLLDHIDKSLKKRSNRARKVTTEEFIKILSGSALAFEPGSDHFYGYNHDILGRIVEIISGMSFGDYLNQNIFKPLGMRNTAFSLSKEQDKKLVPLYTINKWGQAPCLVSDDNAMLFMLFESGGFESGGGGLYSDLTDFSLFCEALLNGGILDNNRIIGEKTLDLVRENQLSGKALETFLLNGNGYGYGLGVRTMMYPGHGGLPNSIGEYGWAGASATWMCIDPAKDMYAVLMLQLLNCGYQIQTEFSHVIYDGLV